VGKVRWYCLFSLFTCDKYIYNAKNIKIPAFLNYFSILIHT
jgi:hypothetical protein